MKKLKDVTGIWKGIYSYELGPQVRNPEPVPFILNLKQGWLGRFTGTVTDEGTDGMPGIGRIIGYLAFPGIEFTKFMPICYVVDEDGRSISMRDHLIEQGYTCNREIPHAPVLYQGSFSSMHSAKGTWNITSTQLPLGDGSAVVIGETSGRWTMERDNG